MIMYVALTGSDASDGPRDHAIMCRHVALMAAV